MSEPAARAGQSSLEADLAAWGKVITLETHGRRSGLPRQVSVGFIEELDGALLIAAAHETTRWALNLAAQPACSIIADGVRTACRATRLAGDEHHATVVLLILKYGTPAERLGSGPAFRLRPSKHAP